MSFAARIGVWKADEKTKCSEEVIIDLDVEDSHNKTGVVDGDDNLPSGIHLGGHAIFTYCVLNKSSLPRIAYDYVVLRLGDSCPAGSFQFARHHDTEDSNNKNDHTGNIGPNVVEKKKDATLEYCFVPRDSSSSKKYPFDNKAYGVFANPDSKILPKSIIHSEFKIDDEDEHATVWEHVCDTNPEPNKSPADWPVVCYDKKVKSDHNNNSWNFYPDLYIKNAADAVAYIRRVVNISKIMYGEDNTYYNVIRWNGGSLKKTAEDADNSVSSAYVAAAPLAPAIKGLNRSVVSVELKSAGDAKISVVNVNGAQIANVVEKNLQPGVHQVKWNSGMVPSGRYIVKIEQNGMVNAENVILK